MVLADYLHIIIKHSQQALNELEKDNKRKALGHVDHIEDAAEAIKWLLINQIKEEEGEL